MAINDTLRLCTVELHDARVSREGVLCGSKVLPPGKVAYLSSSGARPLLVISNHAAPVDNSISLHQGLAAHFGFENRTEAKLQVVEDPRTITAAHIELFFKDQCLSRADMWQMMRQLDGTIVYCGQPVQFLGSTAATVRTVYINGGEVDSALVSAFITKPIFRSESARYTILIEISKEMLEYWRGGDLLYERCLGFLTELFERWEMLRVKHTVSVVVHGRRLRNPNDGTGTDPLGFCKRVVVDLPSTQWRSLLRMLKATFNGFSLPRDVTLAAKSNTLETIYLAAIDFAAQHLDDTRLDGTGSSFLAVTAGAGFFEADFEMLKQTTEILMGNGVGVDLVALSPKPLYPVPLIQYEEDGDIKFALPHWLDISYWDSTGGTGTGHFLSHDTLSPMADIALPLLSDSYPALGGHTLESLADAVDGSVFYSTPSDTNADNKISVNHFGSLEGQQLKANPFDPITEGAPLQTVSSITESALSPGTVHVPVSTPKIDALPKPFMQPSRKISLGPRGLAPGKGVASTTISTEFAGHGKDPASPVAKKADQTSSFLAKQIRDSLRRKPSQFSLDSEYATSEKKSSEETAPLPVGRTSQEDKSQSRAATGSKQTESYGTSTSDHMASSATPKAPFQGFLEDATPLRNAVADESALWLTLLNPCNVKRDNIHLASRYRKWQHVFPKPIRPNEFKWASMCAPAALPLTSEHFPTVGELRRNYRNDKHQLKASGEHEAIDGGHLLSQLTAMRLSYGWQLAASRSRVMGDTKKETVESTLMSLGDHYHELATVGEDRVNVSEYFPRQKHDSTNGAVSQALGSFEVAMHESFSVPPRILQIQLSDSTTKLANWEAIDHTLAGEDLHALDATSHRLRLVLIPVDIPAGGWRTKDLTDEEKRIDGIQKLTQLWQRNRLVSTEDAQHQASISQPKGAKPVADRDPNPLAIEYQTKDTSAVVNAYGPDLPGNSGNTDASAHLFPESEKYHSSNFDIARLVKHMQEKPPHGVELKDRRWFTLLHLQCFRGDELTNWLLKVFKDLTFRDDAIRLGDDLMQRGVFTHVRKKHNFRDGNYFYQIAGVHRTTDYPDTANFFTKGMGWSVPPTPISEMRNSPFARPISGISTDSESSSAATPPTVIHYKQHVNLTQVMKNNLDPGNKSDRPQTVNLHYDRIHNPENCYHIYLDWLSTTPKLVREGIVRWTSLVEAYGLRLVQLPLTEARRQQEAHPFTHLERLKLALKPPKKPPATATPHMGPSFHQSPQSSPRRPSDRFVYHKTLLRKLDFALDLEAAENFTSKLEITYAWGRPDYRYSQYIHKSGLVLAQIVSDDPETDFLLVPNRLAPRTTKHAAAATPTTTTTMSEKTVTIEGIVVAVKSLVQDAEALRAFYEETSKPKMPAPSPFSSALPRLDGADADIPPMQLPPLRGHRNVLSDV